MSPEPFPTPNTPERYEMLQVEDGLLHSWMNNIIYITMVMQDWPEHPETVRQKFQEWHVPYSRKDNIGNPKFFSAKTEEAITKLDGVIDKINVAIKQENLNPEELEDLCNEAINIARGNSEKRYVDWTRRNKYNYAKPKKPRII